MNSTATTTIASATSSTCRRHTAARTTMDDDWITARYLLSSVLGRNPLVVDYVDEESFPVVEPPDTDSPSSSSARRAEAPPPVRAPAGVAGTVCAVCTEEIAAADAVVRLPCAHWYHHGCIAPWLGIRATCPLCRAELPPAEPDEDEEEAGGESGRAGRAKPPVAAAGTSASARVRREAPHEHLAAVAIAVAGGALLSG